MSAEFDAHGFPRGSGIFETIKTIDGAPIALTRHMRRALKSARELSIAIADEESIRTQMLTLLKQTPHSIGRLRICLAPGIVHMTHDAYEENDGPARLNFYSQTVQGSVHKSFPYDDRYAILALAQNEGFDDCLLFNRKNEVTETAVANVAFLIEGSWVTPPITAGILPGVMRAIAIEECDVKVRTVHISEIGEVESAVMLSSLRVIQPVSHIGDMKLLLGDATANLEALIRAHAQPLSVG